MIKLKKHTPEYKEKVIQALDIFTKISNLGSEYYWLFEDYFKISDRHADRYDEVSEDITKLFVEGITYRELYDAWGTGTTLDRRLPFFGSHSVHGTGFIVDVISSVIHGDKTGTAIDKYNKLSELYNLALYLIDNPLPKNSDITQETIELSKTYVMRKEKSDKISRLLSAYKVKKNVIDQVLALV